MRKYIDYENLTNLKNMLLYTSIEGIVCYFIYDI